MRYRWSSTIIESRMVLPELTPCRSAAVDVRFTHRIVERHRRCTSWSHRWVMPDGTSWLSIGSIGRRRLLRFRRMADFIVSADGRFIQCESRLVTAPETIRHLLLDQVLPALASRGRRFGIHASAVAIGGAAVAFLGRTGSGKSTLAAAFGLDGASIVTDDCLMLTRSHSRLVALPTYPSLRLWPAADARFGRLSTGTRVAQYSPKLRIGRENAAGLTFWERRIEVARLYVLDRTSAMRSPQIVPLSPRESYIELLKFRFRLDPRDRASLARECDQLAATVGDVPVARLHIPFGFGALPGVRAAVLADLRNARGG